MDAAGIPDLLSTCRTIDGPLRLDLSGLMSADADGVRVLRRLADEGAELIEATPYIRQLVRENGA